MERTKIIRRIWRAGVATVVLVLTSVTTGQAGRRERLLTEAAHPIVKLDTEKTTVCWLTTHQLLMVTTRRESHSVTDQNGAMQWKAWHGSTDILDTSTHKRRHLTGLTHLLNRSTALPMFAPERFEVSPDGTWLLWETPAWGDGWPCPQAAHLDGSHHREWYRNRYEERFFLNSHSLVQLNEYDPMVVRDLTSPKRDRVCSKPEQAKAVLGRYATQHPVFLVVSDGVERGDGRSIEIAKFRTQDWQRHVHSIGSDGTDAPIPLQKWNFKLPKGAKYLSADVSPQQQSILYDLVVSQSPPHPTSSLPQTSAVKPKPMVTEALWVSRTDGRGMYEIGHVPAHLNADGSLTDGLEDVRWLPDGKHISFVYNGTLYIVPAVPGK